jgi:hypothetical protein
MARTAHPVTESLETARRAHDLIEQFGGRYSTEAGIELDGGTGAIERWALAATLFGNRISASVAQRTFEVLADAGVRTLADAHRREWDELVALLDRGGYTRYDFRTATRLRELGAVLEQRCGGRVSALLEGARSYDELVARLDALPGWGPVTVRVFLRELRGVLPYAEPPLDQRALQAAERYGLVAPGTGATSGLALLRRQAERGGADIRDLEAALVRASLTQSKRRRPR